MRLINRNERKSFLGQHLREPRHAQTLRRDEQELKAPIQIVHTRLPRYAALQSRVNPRYAQSQR